MILDQYVVKIAGEILRAATVAVIVYVGAAIRDNGLPTDNAGWLSLAVGALPLVYAAIRAALNYTPATPGGWGGTTSPPTTLP